MPIAYVQSVKATGNNVLSVTSAGISTTSGNALVAGMALFGAAFSSFTDNGTHVWSTAIAQDFAEGQFMRELYNESITGRASHTFTFTLAANGYPTFAVLEMSGQSASALDQTAKTAESSAGTSHTTPNITLSQAAEILVGFAMPDGLAAVTLTAGGTWTQVQGYPQAAGQVGLILAYKIVASTGPHAFDYSSSVSDKTLGFISSWKEAGGGGGATIRMLNLLGVGS